MNDDHEYAMEYNPVAYRQWLTTTPARRATINNEIRQMREMYQEGQPLQAIHNWLSQQNPQLPMGAIYIIVHETLFQPHIPKLTDRKNKQVPEN